MALVIALLRNTALDHGQRGKGEERIEKGAARQVLVSSSCPLCQPADYSVGLGEPDTVPKVTARRIMSAARASVGRLGSWKVENRRTEWMFPDWQRGGKGVRGACLHPPVSAACVSDSWDREIIQRQRDEVIPERPAALFVARKRSPRVGNARRLGRATDSSVMSLKLHGSKGRCQTE